MRIVGAFFVLLAIGLPMSAQDPAQTNRPRYASVIGTVEKVDSAGKLFTLRTDKREEAMIRFDEKTSFLRLPAGETDTKKATRGSAADVAAGDRAVARVHPEDTSGMPAVFFYFSKQADLAQRQQKTLDEWQTQSVAGAVKAVDAAGKQVTISVRGGFGPSRDVVLDMSGAVDYRRYGLDSGKYEPGTLDSIQAGDQVRVLGRKNADQTQIKAEAIMSCFCKTVPVQIKSIDAATGQISATDLGSKKAITINVKPNTTMKRLDDETALQVARRLNPTFQVAGRGLNDPAAAGAAGGRGGQGRGGRNVDPGKLLEQQPSIQLADLKPGDPIVVTGSASLDMSKLTAMTLVAGVEPILRAAPQNGPDPLGGNWNFGDIGAAPQ
jgi:hypothetical protein